MAESSERIGFDDEQPAAANVGNAAQFARLADFSRAECAPPSTPQVFFILAANETLEVDAPDHLLRAHEVQSGERNLHGCSPAIFCLPRFRSPDAIPSGVAVLGFADLLLVGNQRIALRAQRI